MKKRKIYLGVFLCILLVIFSWTFLEIANNFDGTQIRHFDRRIIDLVQGHISDRLTTIMLWITFFGSVKGVALITFIVCVCLYITRHRLLGMYLAITVALGAGGFNQILKLIFKRARPDIQPIIAESGYSFPSGHSMGSMILYGSLAFILFKAYNRMWAKILGVVVGVVLVFIIGISRIYLGVHYPSDVLGGYLAGAFWILICMIAFTYFEGRGKK
ncbi:phosphatidylglycerophosphatase [Heyndrickxia shackletonii]|uniref:Phosphatidylglycerophosphatase n=1 Tax=Heyndrickxia shackletonii TaxID=157838 RepID=A0A0Q3WX39_9BACI|nr:phosphatase PAP2 family protein [Heyndrickxia shackletonii]KQL53795.1 phosphatidylglycerophosphatase [Heyndrickxia shackletonii]MBB2483512.1 phosphatase PAP2 family protein [Bacillus sp. APMAM]NEZ02276.1 phosphatase PAP2 family protein [Heyndrickxia shackletonii]RTZ53066.1 phosphatase PAP2 family protein [Bacillus sp. SAJ1]